MQQSTGQSQKSMRAEMMDADRGKMLDCAPDRHVGYNLSGHITLCKADAATLQSALRKAQRLRDSHAGLRLMHEQLQVSG
jgi:hypothetical protein